jgi:hypothetical protein
MNNGDTCFTISPNEESSFKIFEGKLSTSECYGGIDKVGQATDFCKMANKDVCFATSMGKIFSVSE